MIFSQPLVSNCLFIYAIFWRETWTSGCKKIATSLQYELRCSSDFLQLLISKLKLNRKILPLTEENNNTLTHSHRGPEIRFLSNSQQLIVNDKYLFSLNTRYMVSTVNCGLRSMPQKIKQGIKVNLLSRAFG